VPGGQRTYRCLVPGRILFDSMASAAESLRSKCGSERRPPECNKQRSPEATPHVGQGTEDNCSGVRSRILIDIECDKKRRNSVQFGTVLKTGWLMGAGLPHPARLTLGDFTRPWTPSQPRNGLPEPPEACFLRLSCEGLSSGDGSGLGKWARVMCCCKCGTPTK